MRRGFLVPKLECEYCLNSRSKDEWNHRYDSNAFKFILMRACICALSWSTMERIIGRKQ